MSDHNPYEASSSPYSMPEPDGSQHKDSGPEGIGGWLILVAIGIVVSPIRLGILMLTVFVPVFTGTTWATLTSPGSASYHPLWGPLLVFELIGNLAFLLIGIVTAILFFRKSRWFPKVYIATMFCSFCYVLLDAWFVSLVLSNEPIFDAETTKELVRPLVATLIWGPYLIISNRAKNTFVV